jgi:hypothetical protein
MIMVRYLEIHKCEECPHREIDANTSDPQYWGKDLCFAFYHDWEEDEDKIRILKDEAGDCPPIPDWCPLDTPNTL